MVGQYEASASRRRLRLLATVVTAVGVVLALGIWLSREDADQQQTAAVNEPVILGLAMQPSSALTIIALERGYFSSEGLDIRAREYVSGKRALVDGLFSGAVDMVTAAEVPVVFASFKRTDFAIIATTWSANNVNRIIARKDHGIAKPADLRGKRIATQGRSAVHFFLHLFLLKHGLSEALVDQSFMKAEELPGALARGEIDAFSMREPYISMARSTLDDEALTFAEPGLYTQMETFAVSRKIVDQRPQIVEKLLRALLGAEEFAEHRREEAIGIVARNLGVDKAAINALWPEVELRVSLEQSLLLALEDEARWAISHELTEQGAVPNYLDLIFLEGMQTVAPERVTVIR